MLDSIINFFKNLYATISKPFKKKPKEPEGEPEPIVENSTAE